VAGKNVHKEFSKKLRLKITILSEACDSNSSRPAELREALSANFSTSHKTEQTKTETIFLNQLLDTIFKIFLISEIKVYKKKSIPSELYLSP
jgi:hypothetical protein